MARRQYRFLIALVETLVLIPLVFLVLCLIVAARMGLVSLLSRL